MSLSPLESHLKMETLKSRLKFAIAVEFTY